jgi:triosephosphate isomerase
MSSRKKLIAGNWKMNKTSSDAVALVQEIVAAVGKQTDVDVVVCPPFTSLESVGKALDGSVVKLGAQNVHPEPSGAFTGETSVGMLRALFSSYVIVGHSERRSYFGETDAFINQKVLAALKGQLKPILCVGETLGQRESGQTLSVVQTQLEGGLEGVSKDQLTSIVVAYEPVWAIGTGKSGDHGTGSGSACLHPQPAGEEFWRGGGGEGPHPLRRLDEAGQRSRIARAKGHRRRIDRGSES